MATYATLEDVQDYVLGDLAINDTDLAEKLLVQCERELDTVLRQNRVVTDAGDRKLDVDILLGFQVESLRNATCAQFEYHDAMGEDFFIKPQPNAVRQPEGGGYDGRLPLIAPKALRELEGTNLVRSTGMVDSWLGFNADPFAWQRAGYTTQTPGGLW